MGGLAERLEKRCRQEKLNKPSAARASVDLDEALMVAMPVRLRIFVCPTAVYCSLPS